MLFNKDGDVGINVSGIYHSIDMDVSSILLKNNRSKGFASRRNLVNLGKILESDLYDYFNPNKNHTNSEW